MKNNKTWNWLWLTALILLWTTSVNYSRSNPDYFIYSLEDITTIENDQDGDGVPDDIDNCPNVANPDQNDNDNNGIGDACEAPEINNCSTVDIIFVLDGSGSVGSANWFETLSFTADLIDSLSNNEADVRFGIVSFSSSATLNYSFNDDQDITTIKDVLTNLPYTAGTTHTYDGINTALLEFLSFSFPGNQRQIILITDGAPNPSSQNPCPLMYDLLEDTISTLIVGVGDFDVYKIDCLVESDEDVILAESFDDLDMLSNDILMIFDEDMDGTADCIQGTDFDGDGWFSENGDCNDNDAEINPNAIEICDGIDNDCNGETDEGFDMDNDNLVDCFDPCPSAAVGLTNFDEETCNCLPGYFPIIEMINGNVVTIGCSICPPGSYCPDGTERLDCAAGTYSDAEGSTICISCSAGTFSESEGSTFCQSCPMGSFSSSDGATECESCPAGSYSDVEGSTVCTSCPAGTFSEEVGSIFCSSCPAGTFSSEVGAVACNSCPAGTFSAIEGALFCTSCPPGSYSSNEGATECSLCPAGSFSSIPGSTACDLCPVDTYNPNLGSMVCLTCEEGTESEEGALECTPISIDCVVSDWSDWSDCSEPCGTGVQTRTRYVITEQQGDGTACPELEETRSCNDQPCIDICGDGIDNDFDGAIDEPENVDAQYEWIESVHILNIDHTSGNDGGYGNHTDQATDVAIGEVNTLEVTSGYAGQAYFEYWTIYIDLDHSGTFEYPTELVGYGSGYYTENIHFTIPEETMPGATTLRIYMQYGDWGFPCDDDFEGEVEDYTVNIETCDNLWYGGSIGNDQFLCDGENDPQVILSVENPSGGSGNVEYLWLKNTTTSTPPSSYNSNGWEKIENSNTIEHDPSPLSQTTWFLRCARREGCTQYLGESNVVAVSVVEACDPEYCESNGESTDYEWIKRVKFGSINNTSGNDDGYGDYTSLTVDLTHGQSKTIKLKPGFSGAAYYEYWRVWVDWNRDGDFDDSNELVVQKSGYSQRTGQVYVPSSAILGTTTMRVSMKYGAYPSPCEVFSEGEVEDYSVNILSNSNSMIQSDNSADATAYNDNLGVESESRSSSQLDEKNIIVYPNPVYNILYVNLPESMIYANEFIISNSQGEKVWMKNIAQKAKQLERINVSNLTEGLYFLTITSSEGTAVTKRFVVSK